MSPIQRRKHAARPLASSTFPAVDPRFGVPKRDDLRFEVLEKPLHADADPEHVHG